LTGSLQNPSGERISELAQEIFQKEQRWAKRAAFQVLQGLIPFEKATVHLNISQNLTHNLPASASSPDPFLPLPAS